MKSLPCALLALAIAAGAAHAQERGVQLQFGYAYVMPQGGFTKTEQLVEAGGGIEVALVGPWRQWIAAVGLQSTKHAVDYDPLVEEEDDLRMIHLYLELRRPFAPTGRIQPFVAGRVGLHSMWNRTAFTDDTDIRVEGDASQKGPLFGISAGLTMPVAAWFSVYCSAGYSYAILGDIDFDGAKIRNSSSNGGVPGVRIGGLLDFGRRQM